MSHSSSETASYNLQQTAENRVAVTKPAAQVETLYFDADAHDDSWLTRVAPRMLAFLFLTAGIGVGITCIVGFLHAITRMP